ncbi:unnamed protein product [Phytophthora fragariaefolia]|uniref:Unnamed protein product n=1 Tax=Phytophthora fragariaefolia TaxID=1490495 RepID=A0A9W6YRS4_9STRA|nr:unnamed protein product [Phytophthora fragariaefolia]
MCVQSTYSSNPPTRLINVWSYWTESSSPQEEKAEDNDEDSSTSPMFWRASANAVEASDSAEPKTFPNAGNGPDQVH